MNHETKWASSPPNNHIPGINMIRAHKHVDFRQRFVTFQSQRTNKKLSLAVCTQTSLIFLEEWTRSQENLMLPTVTSGGIQVFDTSSLSRLSKSRSGFLKLLLFIRTWSDDFPTWGSISSKANSYKPSSQNSGKYRNLGRLTIQKTMYSSKVYSMHQSRNVWKNDIITHCPSALTIAQSVEASLSWKQQGIHFTSNCLSACVEVILHDPSKAKNRNKESWSHAQNVP